MNSEKEDYSNDEIQQIEPVDCTTEYGKPRFGRRFPQEYPQLNNYSHLAAINNG